MGSSNPFELEVTIISAKHLKNVNWKSGDLKPYAIIYLDNSDHRLATHADDYGSTHPVWNERFTLPVTRSIADSVLTLEIFHSRPSETPKPLVGAVKIPLSQIIDSRQSPTVVRDIELIRPSGRPQGKARLKLTLKERPPSPPPTPRPPMPPPPPPPVVQDYHNAPNYSHYYAGGPTHPYNYPDHYGYYGALAYYPPQPPLTSLLGVTSAYRPSYNPNRLQGGPSAPVESVPYDHKPVLPPLSETSGGYGRLSRPSAPLDYSSPYGYEKGGGSATEVSSSMGRLNLEATGSNYEKEKAPDRDSYSYRDYHRGASEKYASVGCLE
ncbi:hypothetical protein LINPERPRIM_LOCUS18049 [Linum perenne]